MASEGGDAPALAPAPVGKKKNRPAGLAPLVAAAEPVAPVNSYRMYATATLSTLCGPHLIFVLLGFTVDWWCSENDGTFIHGRLQITESGVQVAPPGTDT